MSSTDEWVRSTFCADSACIEVALIGGQVALRDSKHPEQPCLHFPLAEWTAFIDGIQAADFDF